MAGNIEVARKLREIADLLATEEDVARLEGERREAEERIKSLEDRVAKVRDYTYRVPAAELLKAAKQTLIKGELPSSLSPEIAVVNLITEVVEGYLEL